MTVTLIAAGEVEAVEEAALRARWLSEVPNATAVSFVLSAASVRVVTTLEFADEAQARAAADSLRARTPDELSASLALTVESVGAVTYIPGSTGAPGSNGSDLGGLAANELREGLGAPGGDGAFPIAGLIALCMLGGILIAWLTCAACVCLYWRRKRRKEQEALTNSRGLFGGGFSGSGPAGVSSTAGVYSASGGSVAAPDETFPEPTRDQSHFRPYARHGSGVELSFAKARFTSDDDDAPPPPPPSQPPPPPPPSQPPPPPPSSQPPPLPAAIPSKKPNAKMQTVVVDEVTPAAAPPSRPPPSRPPPPPKMAFPAPPLPCQPPSAKKPTSPPPPPAPLAQFKGAPSKGKPPPPVSLEMKEEKAVPQWLLDAMGGDGNWGAAGDNDDDDDDDYL